MKNDPATNPTDSRRYAWAVCAGCALLLFCTSGLAVNAYSIYQPFLISVRGFSHAQASTVLTFRNLSSLSGMLLVHVYYRRFSLRTGMVLAGMAIALSFAVYGLSESYALFCLGAVLTGFGYGFGTMIPVSLLIGRWFYEKKDTAIGICSAVTGLSTLGIPSLLSAGIRVFGLKATFLLEAGTIALLMLLSGMLLKNPPEDIGLSPYGKPPEQAANEKRIPVSAGLTKKDWILLFPALLLIGAVMNVSYSHLTVLFTGEGYSAEAAALAISLSGAVLVLGKFSYGRLADSWGNERCIWLFAPLFLIGIALCCLIRCGGWMLYLAMLPYSFGISCPSVGLSTWAVELSDADSLPKTVQRFQVGYSAGCLLFSSLPGLMADRAGGSYLPAFRLFFVMAVLVFAAVLTVFIRHRRGIAKAD